MTTLDQILDGVMKFKPKSSATKLVLKTLSNRPKSMSTSIGSISLTCDEIALIEVGDKPS